MIIFSLLCNRLLLPCIAKKKQPIWEGTVAFRGRVYEKNLSVLHLISIVYNVDVNEV